MKKSAEEKLLKTVIDTNVLVSSLFAQAGALVELMELWANERFDLVTSEEILDELYRVLHKPDIQKHFRPTEEEIAEFIELIRAKAIITPGRCEAIFIGTDPTDNKFLAAAQEAKADFIVSGDKHLKDVKEFQGIKIINARSFIEIVNKKNLPDLAKKANGD